MIGLWKTGLKEPTLAADRGREGRNRGERRVGYPENFHSWSILRLDAEPISSV